MPKTDQCVDLVMEFCKRGSVPHADKGDPLVPEKLVQARFILNVQGARAFIH